MRPIAMPRIKFIAAKQNKSMQSSWFGVMITQAG
jgi:hypothetical protein